MKRVEVGESVAVEEEKADGDDGDALEKGGGGSPASFDRI